MVATSSPRETALRVWLTYFDNPVEMTMGDAAQELGVSRSTVRSAVQSLVAHNLLYPHAAGRVGLYEHDYYDDPTTAFEEAFPMTEGQIDTGITHRANEDERPSSTPPTACRCGCGEMASPKRAYRPGHDARHAGNVGRAIALNPDLEVALLGELPTEALRLKALRVMESEQAKRTAKAARHAARLASPARSKADRKNDSKTTKSEDTYTEGSVKIGRWTYPARAYDSGRVERNTKRDGSGEWEVMLHSMD